MIAEGAYVNRSCWAILDLVAQVSDVRTNNVCAASTRRVAPDVLQKASGCAGFVDVKHEVAQQFEFDGREIDKSAIALHGHVASVQNQIACAQMAGQGRRLLLTLTAEQGIGT